MGIVITTFLLLTFSMARAQEKVMYYQENAQDFPNPERGFYIPLGSSASHFTPLDSASLKQLFAPGQRRGKARYAVSPSLLMREYTLDSFRRRPISQDFLDKLDRDMEVVRKAGLKVILRMAYTNSAKNGDCPDQYKICPPYGDAPKSLVLEHIHQLTPLFRKHADIIAVVQEGFIGIWGENFYTDYFGDPGGNGPGRIMDSSWKDRNEVLHALLDALPKDRMVQVRTPQIKQKYVYGEHAAVESKSLAPKDGFNASDAARIGFHNDCFLSSPDDYGTYYDYGSSVSARKPANDILRRYVADDSRYVPVGGETCDDAYSPQNDCAPMGHAEEEMASLHLSFLNSTYNNDVNNDWDSLGCMESIRKRMGYRFVLQQARLPVHAVAGGVMTIDMRLKNEGYASPFNPRVVELVLRDRVNGKKTAISCKVDIRHWYSGKIVWKETVRLPQDLAEGAYDLLLSLQDPYPTLAGRAAYSIRLANENCWDAATGYNDLHFVLQIGTVKQRPQ
jgi:hypothetical protein